MNRKIAHILPFLLACLFTSLADRPQVSAAPPDNYGLELLNYIGGGASAVATAGNVAYLAIGPGIEVLDISNPANPVRLGYLPLSGNINAIKVQGNYAYIANDPNYLHIIDISNSSTPVVLSSLAVSNVGDIAVADQYAYLACDLQSLCVVDVNQPNAPINITSLSTASPVERVAVSGNHLYLALAACRREEKPPQFAALDCQIQAKKDEK